MFKYSKSIPYLAIMHKNVRVGIKGITNACLLLWEKERSKVNVGERQIWEGGWFIIHCVTIKSLSCLS